MNGTCIHHHTGRKIVTQDLSLPGEPPDYRENVICLECGEFVPEGQLRAEEEYENLLEMADRLREGYRAILAGKSVGEALEELQRVTRRASELLEKLQQQSDLTPYQP